VEGDRRRLIISSMNGRAAHAGLLENMSKRLHANLDKESCLRADWQVMYQPFVTEIFNHVCNFCDASL
jgi:hypothetical protein